MALNGCQNKVSKVWQLALCVYEIDPRCGLSFLFSKNERARERERERERGVCACLGVTHVMRL